MNAPEHASPPPSVALYALTGKGLELALRLAAALDGRVYAAAALEDRAPRSAGAPPIYFSSLSEQVRVLFPLSSCHIFVSAAGIAVRAVAPLLRGKDRDPAVLVLDQRGRHVISLLSGHLGGANAMARRVAALIGATPVITTATDVEDLPALDELARGKGLALGNLEAAKNVSAALLNGSPVSLHDPDNWLGIRGGPWEALFMPCRDAETPDHQYAADRPLVLVTERALPDAPVLAQNRLHLHPPVLFAGVGCRKGAPARAILDALSELFSRLSLAPLSLSGLASLDAKRAEPGLIEAAAALRVPLRFFSAAELAAFPVTRPSPKAREVFGVEGVCESAALAAASLEGGRGELLEGKNVLHGITVALALRRKE